MHDPVGCFERAAEWCAIKGLKGRSGDPLPELFCCADYVAEYQEEFEARVRDYAYAQAEEITWKEREEE